MFGTSTKLDAKPMEIEHFAEICASVSIPVVAIGGITGANASQFKGSGAAGLAVVSGILACENVEVGALVLKEIAQNLNSSK